MTAATAATTRPARKVGASFQRRRVVNQSQSRPSRNGITREVDYPQKLLQEYARFGKHAQSLAASGKSLREFDNSAFWSEKRKNDQGFKTLVLYSEAWLAIRFSASDVERVFTFRRQIQTTDRLGMVGQTLESFFFLLANKNVFSFA
jgi:hypothetical protein